MSDAKKSRRQFLTTAAAAVTAPYFIPGSALGKDGAVAPSERIVIGTIGCGGMGNGNTRAFMRSKDAQVVAVCDVDKQRLAKTAERVNKHYGKSDCATYTDYREVIERKDIDAVIIATPDHWHALCCVAAAGAKKDIYCQKPMTHTFGEGRAVIDAVKANDVIFQVGSQQRSGRKFRAAVELILNGTIGKIKRVEVGLPTGHKKGPTDVETDPPAHLDYDFWCGPSTRLPYVEKRCHWNWRWHLAYGGGQLMDWIGHHNDIAHWGLGLDRSGPVETQAIGFEYSDDRRVWNSAWKYEVLSKYADGYTISISNRNKQGVKWIGEDGWVFVSRRSFEASSPNWTHKDYDPGPKKAYNSPEHHRNFLDGVKTRKECICPAETGHRSITPGYLGLLSESLGGRKLTWDPAKEEVIGDLEADKKLKAINFRNFRDPWAV